MYSIRQVREKWNDYCRPEQLLVQEHERRLNAALDQTISLGRYHLLYEVPEIISGEFALHDVREIAILLIERARRNGFHVKLVRLSPRPFVIRIWGWAVNARRVRFEKNGGDTAAGNTEEHSSAYRRRGNGSGDTAAYGYSTGAKVDRSSGSGGRSGGDGKSLASRLRARTRSIRDGFMDEAL